MKSSTIIPLIRQTYIFNDLEPSVLEPLATSAIRKSLPSGARLFEEGADASYFYLIESGNVDLFRWSPLGETKIYQTLGENQLVGEAAMFSDLGRYPMNATAKNKTKVIAFERTVFLQVCQQCPELSLKIMASMAKKLNQAMHRIDQLTLNNAGQRLVSYLLDLHQQQNSRWLKLPASYGVLAVQLAIAPETLSRLFQKFREKELISGKRKSILLIDLEGLCIEVGLPSPQSSGMMYQSCHTADEGMVGCCNLS